MWKQVSREQVTHSAHSRGQVFPAQIEDREGAAAGHILDVVTEALGSCGQNRNNFNVSGCGLVWGDGLVTTGLLFLVAVANFG